MGDLVDHEAESFKVTVRIKRRPDGGLRAWSDDVPELVLSHKDAKKVLDDIVPALEMILSAKLNSAVKAERLVSMPIAKSRPVRMPEPVSTALGLPAPVATLLGSLGPLANLFNRIEFSAHRCTA